MIYSSWLTVCDKKEETIVLQRRPRGKEHFMEETDDMPGKRSYFSWRTEHQAPAEAKNTTKIGKLTNTAVLSLNNQTKQHCSIIT